jgi:hypothetical protein
MIVLNRIIHRLLIHNYTKKTDYFGANVQLLIIKTREQDPALLFLHLALLPRSVWEKLCRQQYTRKYEKAVTGKNQKEGTLL